MNVMWIALVAVAVALLQSMLFSFSNLRRLHYRRQFNRTAVYEGEQIELIEVIKNVKPIPVPWLRAESKISKHLQFGRGTVSEEREISGGQYHRSVFFLGPFSQITRRHHVTCLKRGHYDVGSVALTAGDLFSVSQKSKQVMNDCKVDVYPRILSENELDTPSTRWQGELAVKRWIMPDPFLTSGVRDYRAGDPQRDIHWRATARTGQLQVKVRDYTADPRMMVILNIQNSEEQWGVLMEYEQEGVEQGLRIAATLCMRALSAGVEAGFASNACLKGERDTGKTIYVPASNDKEQGTVLLTTMARLDIHREETFNTFLEEMSDVTGIDILILSMYDSDQLRFRMEQLRRAGNSVTLMLLEGGKNNAEKAG